MPLPFMLPPGRAEVRARAPMRLKARAAVMTRGSGRARG